MEIARFERNPCERSVRGRPRLSPRPSATESFRNRAFWQVLTSLSPRRGRPRPPVPAAVPLRRSEGVPSPPPLSESSSESLSDSYPSPGIRVAARGSAGHSHGGGRGGGVRGPRPRPETTRRRLGYMGAPIKRGAVWGARGPSPAARTVSGV